MVTYDVPFTFRYIGRRSSGNEEESGRGGVELAIATTSRPVESAAVHDRIGDEPILDANEYDVERGSTSTATTTTAISTITVISSSGAAVEEQDIDVEQILDDESSHHRLPLYSEGSVP